MGFAYHMESTVESGHEIKIEVDVLRTEDFAYSLICKQRPIEMRLDFLFIAAKLFQPWKKGLREINYKSYMELYETHLH
jgi:hypothetical protein